MAADFEACHSVGVVFIPLVVESLGSLDGKAADTIRAIGRLQGQLPFGLDTSLLDPRRWTGGSCDFACSCMHKILLLNSTSTYSNI